MNLSKTEQHYLSKRSSSRVKLFGTPLVLVVLCIIWFCWPVRDAIEQAQWIDTILDDSTFILIEAYAAIFPRDAPSGSTVWEVGVNPTPARLTSDEHHDIIRAVLQPQGAFSRNRIRLSAENQVVTSAHDPSSGRFDFTFMDKDNVIATVSMRTSFFEDTASESVYCEIKDRRTNVRLFGFCAGPTAQLWDLVRP